MTNNLATLNTKLATKLRDTTYATWATGEMDDFITYAVAQLPGYGVEWESDSGYTITINSGVYEYSLPTGMTKAYRIDIQDSSGVWQYAIADGGWEIFGSGTSTAKVRFSAVVNDQWAGGAYVVRGYGSYDLTAKYIPDSIVPLVLAIARAEAYRVMAGDRSRFETWLSRNQSQNVTVNELLQMVNEADAEVERLALRGRQWHKPVPGRI